MELKKTGIDGLDELLKGGLRKNASIILKGGPGSGKTILALQFILGGAKKGEAGAFISAEEDLDDLRSYAQSLGLDIEKYEKEKLIYLIKQPIALKRLMTISLPLDLIKSGKVKRVVLDSLTLFKYGTEGELNYRRELLDLISNMKSVLFLATAEEKKHGVDEIESSSEDYLFDGIIRLMKVRKTNNFERCIYVSKMRGQEHLMDIFPFSIKKNGIEVYPNEIPFSLITGDFKNKYETKKS